MICKAARQTRYPSIGFEAARLRETSTSLLQVLASRSALHFYLMPPRLRRPPSCNRELGLEDGIVVEPDFLASSPHIALLVSPGAAHSRVPWLDEHKSWSAKHNCRINAPDHIIQLETSP